jgi:YidC/Oxa1 family membrane protein insertase
MQDITVENEVYTAVFTSLGGRLKSLRLKHYPDGTRRDSPPLEMVKAGLSGELPLVFRLEGKDMLINDDVLPYEVSGGNIHIQGDETASIEFRGKTSNGTALTKTFSFDGQTYGITLTVKAEGPQ